MDGSSRMAYFGSSFTCQKDGFTCDKNILLFQKFVVDWKTAESFGVGKRLEPSITPSAPDFTAVLKYFWWPAELDFHFGFTCL